MWSDLTTLDPDVLAQVVGALVVMTPEGEILPWDRGAEILFGFSPEEALRRSIFDLVIPADRAPETREQMRGDEEKALEAGCDGYLAKPIDTRMLASIVADYIAGRGGTQAT